MSKISFDAKNKSRRIDEYAEPEFMDSSEEADAITDLIRKYDGESDDPINEEAGYYVPDKP